MMRRWPALVVIASLIAALVVLGDAPDGEVVAFGDAEADVMPETDRASAVSSTWYCAAGTAVGGGEANLTVVVANLGGVARSGTITWMPSDGSEGAVVPIEVAPDSVTAQAAADHVDASGVSALVELDGGEVAVEHAVSGPRGSGVAPCASEASTEWYLANGVTERDARQAYALFNPFPDDVVVDITFSTDEGRRNPGPLQGLPIAAGTTTFVPVHDFVQRQAVTAASIVARTGRLVVDRVQNFDGSLGRRGVSLALAAPAPAELWQFPDGLHTEGVTESWHIYNPGDREALVSLELQPVEGDAPEPFDLTIPPRTQMVVPADEERVPAGVAHSSTIRSLNGVGVVAERAVDARSPSARRGWSSALGAPAAADRWAFPMGEASRNTDQWIVIYNPGARPVTVSVIALANGQRLPIEGLQDRSLDPAGRLALRLGDHINRRPLPVVVEATGAVVVERDVYGVDRTGVSTIIGIPVR